MVCRLLERASLAGAARVALRCGRGALTVEDDAPGMTLKQLASLVRGWEKSPEGTPLVWCKRLVVASRREGATSAVAFEGRLARTKQTLDQEGTRFVLSGARWKGDLSKRLRALLRGRFEELTITLNDDSLRRDFLEGAHRLGRKSFTVGEQRFNADLYLVPLEQASASTPGFHLPGREPGWLDLFEDDPWAALARVVVTPELDPTEPRARAWLMKLGEFARRRSAEAMVEVPVKAAPSNVLGINGLRISGAEAPRWLGASESILSGINERGATTPGRMHRRQKTEDHYAEDVRTTCPPEARDTIAAWLESPRFEERYRELGANRPPVPTLRQLLECLARGQAPVEQLAAAVEIPRRRVVEILRQAAPLFTHEGRVALSTSFDGRVILLDLDRLAAFYRLKPGKQPSDRGVEVKTSSGEVLAFAVPIKLEAPERRVLEAMGRHGKMNERELASALSTRRVGGLMETLISRLEKAGWTALVEEGEGPEGRVYALRRELIA